MLPQMQTQTQVKKTHCIWDEDMAPNPYVCQEVSFSSRKGLLQSTNDSTGVVIQHNFSWFNASNPLLTR